MIDFDKYSYNGWGLSKNALIELNKLIHTYKLKNVLEFGSGQSTYFLNEVGINYTSFDDNEKYSSKVKNVIIRPLVQLNDDVFNDIITNKINYLEICESYEDTNITHTRQKNCFYKLKPNDILDKFDLVIIDGPHGNGRSISFNVIKSILEKNAFIFIDDYTHYPFVEHLYISFPNAKLHYTHNSNNDSFQIYQII